MTTLLVLIGCVAFVLFLWWMIDGGGPRGGGGCARGASVITAERMRAALNKRWRAAVRQVG